MSEYPVNVWPDVYELAMQVFDEAFNPSSVLPTGIDLLDDLLDGGLRGGELMIMAARPRVGKSALALQIITHLLGEGVPVGLWSLEMSNSAWLRRMLANLASVNSRSIRTGDISEIEADRIRNTMPTVMKLPLVFAIGDSDPATFSQEATAMVKERGTRLIVVDYLQLMKSHEGAYNRENEVSTISRTAKLLAIQLDIPVLMLAQLNRGAEGSEPTFANIRESGALEQDADQVVFLHRDYDEDRGCLEDRCKIRIAKNREGVEGQFSLRFDGRYMRFIP